MAKKRKRGQQRKSQAAKPAPAPTAPVEKPKAEPAEAKGDDGAFVVGDKRTDDKPLSRGAQRRQANRARARQAPAAQPSVLGPAPEPTFWFGFEIAWAKLLLTRVVVFALLAIDAITEIAHAPRYGAGNFNVAHFSFLEVFAPGRPGYAIGQLLLAYLFVLVVCGVATRVVLPIATAIYGWLYFTSQLDSYQHHYLVWLVLLLACFVPWQRPHGAVPATPVRAWGVRLILIQLAILYFYAAISKMNDAWLDGRTLSGQIFGTVRSMIDATIGIKAASWLIIFVELALAVTVWWRRTWIVAAPLGLALHIGIAKTGLEIGLFAWLMIGLYILIVPDRIWVVLGDQLVRVKRWIGELPPFSWYRDTDERPRNGVGAWFLWIVALGIGVVLAVISRFDYAVLVGMILLGVVAIASIVWRKRLSIAMVALAHVLAFTTWTIVDRAHTTASDYYRFWGGSSRRLGNPKTAEYAYRKMTEIDPENGQGHYQLARLLLARNADDEAIAALHKAQDTEPLKARSYIAEARWLQSKGRNDEALEKATIAAAVEPESSEAKALLDSLQPK